VFGIYLRGLRLNQTAVTDAGLQYLQAIPSLEELSLAESKISDQGLEQLEALSGLRSLDLNGSRVTDTGSVSVWDSFAHRPGVN
jgi:Leucine-rich repeat (LRR) protein